MASIAALMAAAIRPLSTTTKDNRIDFIPIPLRLNQDDENDTKIQDALLPYFAMGFTTVPTQGTGSLCGLYALATSFQAAQNALRKPGTPKHHRIRSKIWQEWLNSELYETVCHEMAGMQEGLYTEDDRDNWARKLMASRNNLDNAELSCLLRVANMHENTNFQLGMVFAGWRGRRVPKDKQKYDNKFVYQTHASTSDRKMGNGPMLWIFNSNKAAAESARSGRKGYNHWEGFAYDSDFKEDDPRVKSIHNYGVGHLVEADIGRGVWFLTEDSSSNATTPDHIEAEAGMFVREASPPPDVIIPPGHRYMRSSSGERGLVPEAKIEKVSGVNRMPKKSTDPTEDIFSLLGVSSNPALALASSTGPGKDIPHTGENKENDEQNKVTQGEDNEKGDKQDETTKGEGKNTTPSSSQGLEEGEIDERPDDEGSKQNAESGEEPGGNPGGDKKVVAIHRGITEEDPRIDPPFRYRKFKLFRVLPPTTKVGKSNKVPPKVFPGRFNLKEGDFLRDIRRDIDLEARVRDINGLEGDVPLRRLQALKNPWSLPDRLPLAPRRNYMIPEKDTDVIALAEFLDHANEIDFSSMDSIRSGLEKMLAKKKTSETKDLALARITRDLLPACEGVPSCQKGEIVKIMGKVKGGKKIRVVNYEGYQNMIPEDGLETFEHLSWGLAPLYYAEWHEIKGSKRLPPDEDGDNQDLKPKKRSR